MAEELPLLTKRVYDARVFSVDVKPKLREGDSVTSFTSVAVAAIKPPNAELPVVGVDTFDSVGTAEWLRFNCSGGVAGASYRVALRYVSDTESQLESVVEVRVV